MSYWLFALTLTAALYLIGGPGWILVAYVGMGLLRALVFLLTGH